MAWMHKLKAQFQNFENEALRYENSSWLLFLGLVVNYDFSRKVCGSV